MKREFLVLIIKSEAKSHRDHAANHDTLAETEAISQQMIHKVTAQSHTSLAGIWDEVAAEVEAVLTELNDLREVHEQMIRDLDACEKALDLCENPARKSLGIAGELAGDF
jgi:hypothetical protein